MSNNFTAQNATGSTITFSSTDIGGGVEAPSMRICNAAASAFMPTMDVVGNAGYVYVTDGTHTMPTMDVAGRAGFVQLTDGTHTMPAADAKTRALFNTPTDGTNNFLSGSATNLVAKSTVNAELVTRPGQWAASSNPGVNAQATASQAAAGAGVRNVCQNISVTLCSDAVAPTAVQLVVNLRDDATGAGTILASWTIAIPATAGANTNLHIGDLNIIGTANKAMTLEFAVAGGVHTYEACNLFGTTCQ